MNYHCYTALSKAKLSKVSRDRLRWRSANDLDPSLTSCTFLFAFLPPVIGVLASEWQLFVFTRSCNSRAGNRASFTAGKTLRHTTFGFCLKEVICPEITPGWGGVRRSFSKKNRGGFPVWEFLEAGCPFCHPTNSVKQWRNAWKFGIVKLYSSPYSSTRGLTVIFSRIWVSSSPPNVQRKAVKFTANLNDSLTGTRDLSPSPIGLVCAYRRQ